MKLPKTLEKYRYMLDNFNRTTVNKSNFVGSNFEENQLFYLVELKFPYISDNQTNIDGFKTVKEVSKYLVNCNKDLEGIFYDLEEVFEILTVEELEEVKKNMSGEELKKYFPVIKLKKKLGRPVGTTQEIIRNKRLEIKTTSEMNTEIRMLIKEYKKKYGIKNSDEVLLELLKKGLEK